MPKKTFNINTGFDLNDLTIKLVEYLQIKMKLDAISDSIDGGYHIQAKQPFGLKSVSGNSLKAEIIFVTQQNDLIVDVSVDQEFLKKGVAIVKMFIFPPLVVTDLAGSAKQFNFPKEIFKLVEKYIKTNGKESLYL